MESLRAVSTGSTQSRLDRGTPREALDRFAALLVSLAVRCTQERSATAVGDDAPGQQDQTCSDAD